MGADTTTLDAYIENDEGNAIVKVMRLTKPGLPSIRATTDEQWQSIVDCIAAAPEMVAVLNEVRYRVANHLPLGERPQWEALLTQIDNVLAKAEPPREVTRTVNVTVQVEVTADSNTPLDVLKRRAFDSVYTAGGAGVAFKNKIVNTTGELWEV
jgi:hypothetical protein